MDTPLALDELLVVDAELEVRDAARREIDLRLVPWDTPIDTLQGVEVWRSGAFDGTAPSDVLLMGLEHEASIGLDQAGKPTMVRRPVGRGIGDRIDNRADGAHMTVRVARTGSGDELLALASDGIVTGASVEFFADPVGTVTRTVAGRRTVERNRVRLAGVSLTYRPAFKEAGVLAVRAEGVPAVPDIPETSALVVSEPLDFGPVISAINTQTEGLNARQVAVIEKMEALTAAIEHQTRTDIDIPGKADDDRPEFGVGDWVQLVTRIFSGEKISQKELEVRVAAELITTDNLGVVPEQFLPEIIGIIDPSRPFLSSTRRLNTPRAGMTFNVPVIGTRPTVGVQAAEKDELVSTTTAITDTSFTPITIGGYGDISIQLLRRSDPSYLDLYVELLAEAYAIMADDRAVDVAIAASGIHSGGALDPDNLALGAAWANGSAVSRRLTPDTIWLSSDAVAAFINAKASGTNAPLYSDLIANFTAAGGVGGTISGLRPVHVPALDDEAVDILVGPSRGFAWAEDGTFTLQVDVPAKAGRDVALVGMIWNMPLYPAAFTKYTLAS